MIISPHHINQETNNVNRRKRKILRSELRRRSNRKSDRAKEKRWRDKRKGLFLWDAVSIEKGTWEENDEEEYKV